MIGRDDGSPAIIDARESGLRVMAACSGTIIAGWATHAAGQLAAASGWPLLIWAAACLWSVLWCAFCVARAFGRRKGRTVWLFAGGYALHLPFITLLSFLGGPSPTGRKPILASSGYSVPLAVGSIAILAGLAILGYVIEQLPPRAPRRHLAG